MKIELPSLLEMPEKLLPIVTNINDYRYFLIEGGRGGAKSQSVARLILYLADKMNIRIVCGRETQNSIAESVYSLMTDLIQKNNLFFEVQSKAIQSKSTGSVINFRGFRDQGAFNIQGMEGIDILWIDEAQAITKQTLDVLIPTIRKNQSKIFFTMNRFVHNDPVFSNFVGREDCLHIHINFQDNKFCPDVLKREAEKCRLKSETDYNHIWLGQPLAQADDQVFTHTELEGTKKNVHQIRAGYDYRIAGFDIARFGDDKCACVIIQQMGALHWEVIHVQEWDKQDLVFTTGRIQELVTRFHVNRAVIDEDGIGAGPLDTLTFGRKDSLYAGFRNPAIGYKDNRFYGNNRTVNTYKLKDLISNAQIRITDDELLAELETLRYTFDTNQRKILLSKDKMKKEGVKSPNMADALIMAVSLVGEVKEEQDRQYVPRSNYSREDNLFTIAGIR